MRHKLIIILGIITITLGIASIAINASTIVRCLELQKRIAQVERCRAHRCTDDGGAE